MRIAIDQQLAQLGSDPSLEQLWGLMDQALERCGCDNRNPYPDRLASFFSGPVWLLNGMFIAPVAALAPKRVLDFGGCFGPGASAGQCPTQC